MFANTTIWEREVREPFEYYPSKPAGRNYVSEGRDLRQFAHASCDFALSCHNLEHIANPVRALKEWIRVTKPAGCIILVLPDCRRTFDHSPPQPRCATCWTATQTILMRTTGPISEEILAKHDLRKDAGAGSWDNFRRRSLNNLQRSASPCV